MIWLVAVPATICMKYWRPSLTFSKVKTIPIPGPSKRARLRARYQASRQAASIRTQALAKYAVALSTCALHCVKCRPASWKGSADDGPVGELDAFFVADIGYDR
jgi:hypothetical protein